MRLPLTLTLSPKGRGRRNPPSLRMRRTQQQTIRRSQGHGGLTRKARVMSTHPNDVSPTTEVTKPSTDAVSETEGKHVGASEAQFAANRENARKSTGPRTAEGKEASRMNAVKHGILSTAVVVRGLRIREHEEEFKDLRQQCWECLAPVGRMEEMLVDKIVAAQWRSRRALIAETGEIVKSVDGGRQHRADREPLSPWIFMDPTHDASVAMTKSSAGLEYRKHILETVRENVKRDGELTEKTLDWVRRRFMNEPNNMTRALGSFGRCTWRTGPPSLPELPLPRSALWRTRWRTGRG